MNLLFDSLGLRKFLERKGLGEKISDGIAEAIKNIDIYNLASKEELESLATSIVEKQVSALRNEVFNLLGVIEKHHTDMLKEVDKNMRQNYRDSRKQRRKHAYEMRSLIRWTLRMLMRPAIVLISAVVVPLSGYCFSLWFHLPEWRHFIQWLRSII